MASAYPTAAENAPLGADGRARPVSPTHSTGTVAPTEEWDSDSIDDADGRANAIIQNPFMGASTSRGPSEQLYPDLEGIQNLTPGAGRTHPTAPNTHIWFTETQEPNQSHWNPFRTMGGQASSSDGGRLPPSTPELNAMSWQIPPRTTHATAERMHKVTVHSKRFEQFIPPGNRPFVVNPANRGLLNGAGLALAIEKGAGIDYVRWCCRTVANLLNDNKLLEDGEVVVCEPYLLALRGYQGIVNVAMQNIEPGTPIHTQTAKLTRYYENLFRKAYELHMDSLVMSLFGVGTWKYDPSTSIWCFLDAFQRTAHEGLEIALLVPNVIMANTVRRALMEAWPRDQREGWGDAFETPPPNPVAQELSATLQAMALRQNQSWPGQGEENLEARGGRNSPPGTQSLWSTTWPPAGPGSRGQGQGLEALGIGPRSPTPAQPTSVTPGNQPVPDTSRHRHPTEAYRGEDRGERSLGPQPSLIDFTQDPVGTPRLLLAPAPLYQGGAGLQSHTSEPGESRGMPTLHLRHIPPDSSRVFVPIQSPRVQMDPRRPLATSTPSHGMVRHPDASAVPEATHFIEVSGQSAPQGSLSEGQQTTISGAHDTLMNIIVSDQDIEQGTSRDTWSLLTFTNPSLTKSARWETHIMRKGGAPYQELRKTIMDTRSGIGLCPGKAVGTQRPNIFPAVTKVVHLTLRKTTFEGSVLPESDQTKMFNDIKSLIQDRSLFEGYGSPDRPYRMIINMKWGRYKVQGLKKAWMWEAIAAALSSINDPDHMIIQLMVDPTDKEAVENTVEQFEGDNEDLDEDSRPHNSSGQLSQRDSANSGPRSRGSSHNAQSSPLISSQGTGQQELSERGRSRSRRRAGVRFNSLESHSRSTTPRSILRQSSSHQEEEEESEETGSDWEAEYDGRGPPSEASRVPRPSSRASSTSQSRSRSQSRERRTYPRGEPPRAKNKRAKAIKLRPLRQEPPLRGHKFRTSSDLHWSSGISDISDDSEGELAGHESGQMLPGYPVKWATARALARSPSAERVLAQPGLTGPYKEAYLQAGYDLLREQLIERDTAMAQVARVNPSGENSLMRGHDSSSYYTRPDLELASRLALPPVGSSTPHSAYSSLPYPNGGLVQATGYSSGMGLHAHDFLQKVQTIKQLAPEKISGENQASYLRRTAQMFEGSELYHDPETARVLGQVKGIEVPRGASLSSLLALDVRTPGIDPGERLVEELFPMVTEGKLTLAVAAETITQAVPVGKSTLLLEKLFTRIPAGNTLAVSCAQWTQEQLRAECIKYDQINQLRLLKRTQGNQKGPGPPKQTQQKEVPEKDPPKKSQPKTRNEARDSKNERRGVSKEGASKEDPPQRPQKQAGKGAPQSTKYLSAEEWAALPKEEKDKRRALREAAKAATQAQAD